MSNQRIADIHDQLVERLGALTSSDEWLAWLSAARAFHRYSPQNQMLLAAQGADGLVASYRTWQRIPAVDGGTCQVRQGEKGLTILAPLTVSRREIDEATGDELVVGKALRGFRPVNVFHQGQLVAAPDVPDQPLPELLTGENRWQHVWAAVTGNLDNLGYNVELVTRSPVETWNGRTHFGDAHVEIADHLEAPQQVKTLIHEWAHIALDHGDRLTADHQALREVEAESVAYLVCSTIGLDSAAYSLPYLAGWSGGDRDLLQATARRVLSVTHDMIGTLETELAVEITPDVLSVANGTVTALQPDSPRPPLRIVDAARPDDLAISAPADLRPVLEALMESDRGVFLDSITRLDTDLDVITALCADAGFDADATIALLTVRGADPRHLHEAMARPVVDTHGEQAPLFTDLEPVERLDVTDRDVLSHLDLSRPHHVVIAVTLLSANCNATDAVDILGHYGADLDAIDDAMRREFHNPASGRAEPRWPSAAIDAALTPATTTPLRAVPEPADPEFAAWLANSPATRILEEWSGMTPSPPSPPTVTLR